MTPPTPRTPQNFYYLHTLRGIGDYFRRYDLTFFAHRRPPDIDYPLLLPADEALTDAGAQAYLTSFADSLLPRLEAALPAGDLSHVFISTG